MISSVSSIRLYFRVLMHKGSICATTVRYKFKRWSLQGESFFLHFVLRAWFENRRHAISIRINHKKISSSLYKNYYLGKFLLWRFENYNQISFFSFVKINKHILDLTAQKTELNSWSRCYTTDHFVDDLATGCSFFEHWISLFARYNEHKTAWGYFGWSTLLFPHIFSLLGFIVSDGLC